MAAVPSTLAVVLHFDSPGFAPWLQKWMHHAKGDRSKPWDKGCLDKFRYYRDSIEVVSRDSTMEEKLALYSSFRCLPPPEQQAQDPKWSGLVDFDILGKIMAACRIMAPSLYSSHCQAVAGPPSLPQQQQQPSSQKDRTTQPRAASNTGKPAAAFGMFSSAPPGTANLQPKPAPMNIQKGVIPKASLVGQYTHTSPFVSQSALISSCQNGTGGYQREQSFSSIPPARSPQHKSVEAPRLVVASPTGLTLPPRSGRSPVRPMPTAPQTARLQGGAAAWPVFPSQQQPIIVPMIPGQ